MRSLTAQDREELREHIIEASEPIAQFWPMKTFIHHNPIHGLEHLPFEQAIREAKYLLGGNGYLPNHEYRQFYHEGRITEEGVEHALRRVWPRPPMQTSVQIGRRPVTAIDVRRVHLLFGVEVLEPALLQWAFSEDVATTRFRQDLPEASRKRIIERTIQECEKCRHNPEASYLANLWTSTLRALNLFDPQMSPISQTSNYGRNLHYSARTSNAVNVELPYQRTMSDWVDALAGTSLADRINSQMIKWSAAFVDEGLATWEMPSRHVGFYRVWQELAQRDHSGRFLGIQSFSQKVRDLMPQAEDAIIASLNQLGIPKERWREYLSRQLAQLSGWAGFIRWRGENPEYHAQRTHPIDPVQYLAVRLFYEVELTQVVCRQEWGIDGTVPDLVAYWQSHCDEYEKLIGQDSHAVDHDTQAICHDAWRLLHLAQFLELSPLEVQEASEDHVKTLLNWLDGFPSDQHGPVWLEAYEGAYRRNLLGKLSTHRGTVPPLERRPLAQAVFCIDVRSESFRRHLEAQGPYETFGFAGFFGIPISHQAFDSEDRMALCPVLLSPNHAVTETPRSGEETPLQKYSSGTRWHQLGHHLFHDLKHNPIGSMMLIDILGVFFSLGLIGKTLILKPYHTMKARIQRWFAYPVETKIDVHAYPSPSPQDVRGGENTGEGEASGLAQGFSTIEKATFIENGLRTMGLTKNFGRLIVLCGHGSVTDNNPYFGALDCGACGGNHGDPNARVFAAMGNNPQVRRILKEKGLLIPDDTWFLAGKHNTTTDRVRFYDVEDVPASHAEDLRVLSRDLVQAGANQALERCHRIPQAPRNIAPEKAYAHVEERGVDWANPRPEWGLSSNAAFLIGRRSLTKELDLGGRVFLHSYDPVPDPEGAFLEKIMMAPLIVGEWINMEHYFSAVDPWFYGSGSKVIHNVVSGIGVMLGSQSDLQTGLPLQTVNNGSLHYHEPMRLLTIIEAPPDRIAPIIQKHILLQHLFHNQWVNLVALDPATFNFYRYNPDATWEHMAWTAGG